MPVFLVRLLALAPLGLAPFLPGFACPSLRVRAARSLRSLAGRDDDKNDTTQIRTARSLRSLAKRIPNGRCENVICEEVFVKLLTARSAR